MNSLQMLLGNFLQYFLREYHKKKKKIKFWIKKNALPDSYVA